MGDKLNVVVIAPAKIAEKMQDYIGISIKSAEMIYRSAGWDVEVNHTIVSLAKADGTVYDKDFQIRDNLVSAEAYVAAAKAVSGGGTRRHYVVFLTENILTAKDMATGFADASNSNGVSVTGSCVSALALPPPKSAIGDSDGHTWAHEIGHGLGLTHHTSDKNLMYDCRTTARGALSGNGLTADQLKTMRETLKNLNTTGL